MGDSIHRREVLKGLAAGPLLTAAGIAAEASPAAVPGTKPREVRIAVIGAGDRGTYFLREALSLGGVAVAAICDIDPAAAARAAGAVREAGGREPAVVVEGPRGDRKVISRDDVDAVLVTTPAPLHGPMAADALRAGKWVFSEVPACHTVAEAWDLVRAAEESGSGYFLAENYCFRRENLLVLGLVEKGVLGEPTFAECGYIHDCRPIAFNPDGTLTWRGKENSDPAYRGNSYPTHSLGPIGLWLGINRGDRFARCVTLESRAAARRRYAAKRFGPDSAAARVATWNGDTVQSLIVTERGVLVSVRFDSASPRPHRMAMATLQGTEGSYDDERGIYLEGRSRDWEPIAPYEGEADHPLWRSGGAGGGHDGADRLTMRHFLDCARAGRTPAIDVYDGAAWSVLVELSRLSILAGGAPQEFPDFTRGRWKERKRYDWSQG